MRSGNACSSPPWSQPATRSSPRRSTARSRPGIRRRSGSTNIRRRKRSATISTSSFRRIVATSISGHARWSLADQPVENFETVRSAKGGRRIDVALSIRPVKSPSGEIVGVAKITRDITEQKSPRKSSAWPSNPARAACSWSTASGKIVMVNTEIERLFGYRREELIGQPVEILVPMRLRAPACRHRDGFCARSRDARAKGRARAAATAQGRHRVPGRGGAQSDPDPRGPARAQRGRRYQRAQAHGALEGRIRLDGEPRAAHAADLDFRLARPAHGQCGRPPARQPAPAHDRANEQPAAGPAGQRHSRHREDRVRPGRLSSQARPDARAGRAGDRGQSRFRRRLRRAGFGSTRSPRPARCTPIPTGSPRS